MALSRNRTPAEALETVLDEWGRANFHTAMPGIIESVNMNTRRARVKFALEAVSYDGTCFERAPLLDVPIIYPAGSGGIIIVHLAAGDSVWVMFSERGLQTWKESFDVSEPMPHRVFSQSDAVALAGFGPHGTVTPRANQGISIQTLTGNVSIRVDTNGITLDVPSGVDIKLGAAAIKRLLTDSFIDAFNMHTHRDSRNQNTSVPNSQITKSAPNTTELVRGQ